jgi:hypothetical protein
LTSQLFESASLEEALADVRDTVGPHAKIVRAEKVRRGGIGGFFTKESFVLSVERDGSIMPADGHQGDYVHTPPAQRQLAQPTAQRYAADVPAAYSLDALADLADLSDSGHPATFVPSISTETPLFGQVLREATMATALDRELPAGPRWDGSILDLDEPYRSVMPLAPAPTAPATPPQQPAKHREIALEPYPDAPPQQPWWQVLATVAEAQHATPTTIDLQSKPPAPPSAPPVDHRLGHELFGVHPVAAPSSDLATRTAGLEIINAALGPALLPGSVIAVVGHPCDAGTVAARVAVAAAADPFSIHFASNDAAARTDSGLPAGRQVGSVDEAILRSRRWPSRPTPVVVVVDGRDGHWARTVLDAIEATTVVALPSPTDDDDAVRSWVAELGGVQALLVDASCRTTPESLALLGIPALRSPWSLGGH